MDNLDNLTEKLRETFREEAYELLAELEAGLLALEHDPGNMELIGRIFRAMHTIKGSGGTCGFNDIASFTHDLETMFDRVRKGKLSSAKEIITLTLEARDHIQSLFDAYYKGGVVDPSKGAAITAALNRIVPRSSKKSAASSTQSPARSMHDKGVGKSVTYRIRIRPKKNMLTAGANPLELLNELRAFGPCHVVAHTEDIPYLEDYEPEGCYAFWDVVLTTAQGLNALQDLFMLVKDSSDISINTIDDEDVPTDDVAYKQLGEILLERGDLTPEELQTALKSRKRIGEKLIDDSIVPQAKIEAALIEQQVVRDMREQRHSSDALSSIRVATGKLDSLVDLVGELVTVQARLSQTALTSTIPALLTIAEEVERLTASLRDNAMNIRMLPIGTTFGRFQRLVRDLSAELGKEIELTTAGAETELDKTVIERLSNPLVHIIRNSIDHGIEHPDERAAAGKPKQGTIHLSAIHSGAHVLISIQDDGAGLDTEKIRAKAIEKGLLQAEAAPTEQELFECILAPGFSTAKSVTGVSGRGVGMDVVKKAIDALRGSIEISSAKGAGTTITLKLPLTLAIIDGFLTKTGNEHFIFPLSLVEECVERDADDVAKKHGRNMANVRGRIVPYIRLRDFFAINGDTPKFEQIVITNVDNQRVGLVVDAVVGEHQTVLKSLGKFYQDVEGISGATILGDGTVALILDIPKLVRMVEQQEVESAGGSALS